MAKVKVTWRDLTPRNFENGDSFNKDNFARLMTEFGKYLKKLLLFYIGLICMPFLSSLAPYILARTEGVVNVLALTIVFCTGVFMIAASIATLLAFINFEAAATNSGSRGGRFFRRFDGYKIKKPPRRINRSKFRDCVKKTEEVFPC